MKWYILQALSGQEKRIQQAIQEKVAQKSLSEYLGSIVIPSEKVVEVRKGKKVDVEKKMFPGYILIQMDLNDALWSVISSISRIGKFLGINGKPSEISEAEVQKVLNQAQEQSEIRQKALVFEVGDSVKINDGPFESFVGKVEDVDGAKNRLKVSVTIFGRSTPLDLDFAQVTKVVV